MSDIDSKTLSWLSTLKLSQNITNINDFKNGYNFGAIFDKLNLCKGKKYKNNSDLACIFQNYKNTKDLLYENFKIQFPVQNLIYQTQQLLYVIRDECIKYVHNKKQAKLDTMMKEAKLYKIKSEQQGILNLREKKVKNTMNQTRKLPKKIQQIDKKLKKFSDEKMKHELLALEEQKIELQKYHSLIEDHRQFQMTKTRKNHQNIKQMEKKVYDVWSKTELIKKNRNIRDQQLHNFQQSKNKKLKEIRKIQQKKSFQDGLDMFQLNCVRQGVELYHDLDKPFQPDTEQFNKVVVMERIKDKINKHQNILKQGIKRQNKKNVQNQFAKIKSQSIWKENNCIEDYQIKLNQHILHCDKIYQKKLQKNSQKEYIKNKFQNKQFQDLPSIHNQEERQMQFRKNYILFLNKEVKRVQKKYGKRKKIADEVIETLLEVTIQNQDKFRENKGFKFNQWQQIQKQFINFKNKQIKYSSETSYVDINEYQNDFLEYVQKKGKWQQFRGQKPEQMTQFAQFIKCIIDKAHPSLKMPEKDQNLPLYMPLKIMFIGDKLTGKSTLATKICAKYGCIIIDPNAIIKSSLQLAKSPNIQEVGKKNKKEAKKQEEITPQKLALKQFGQELLHEIQSIDQSTIKHLIAAIKFKIKQTFKRLNDEELIAQFQQSFRKEQDNYNQALKQQEEGSKKPKKDTKKVVAETEEPLVKNKYPYCKGFVLENMNINIHDLRIIERQINSFITPNQIINQTAQEIKEKLRNILPIPQIEKDNKLHSGTFDLLIQLQTNQSNLNQRNKGKKIDPQTQKIYHPIFNPVPNEKGLAQRLVDLEEIQIVHQNRQKISEFYACFGYQTTLFPAYHLISTDNDLQSTLQSLNSIIEKSLDSYYGRINKLKQQIDAKKNIQSEQKQQKEKMEQKEKKGLREEKQGQNDQKQQKKTFKEQNTQLQNKKKYINTQENDKQIKIIQQQNTLKQRNKQIQKNILKQQKYQDKQTIKYIIDFIQQDILQIKVKEYLQIYLKYSIEIKKNFLNFHENRINFGIDLLKIQTNFIDIINRPNYKIGQILNFQQNYNKLLNEKNDIVKDNQASKHLILKLDQLYDSLWQTLENKKNQAVIDRKNFIQSDWLNKQTTKIIEIVKNLLQNQLNYFIQTLIFILQFSNLYKKSQVTHKIDYEHLCLGIPSEYQPIDSVNFQNMHKNDRLQYYEEQTQKCISSIPDWLQKIINKNKINIPLCIKSLIIQTMKKKISSLQIMLHNIHNKVIEQTLEYRCYFNIMINKMDDWILIGIENQNKFVYQIYKLIKTNILQAKKSTIRELYVKKITQIYHPLQNIIDKSIPICLLSQNHCLPIYSFIIFLQEIRCLVSSPGKIIFSTFKIYFNKRKKSNLLHKDILNINYDTMQQYLVSDGSFNYKDLILAILFWSITVPNQDTIQYYKRNLTGQPHPKNSKSQSNNSKLQQPQQTQSKQENTQQKQQNKKEFQEQDKKQQQQELQKKQKNQKVYQLLNNKTYQTNEQIKVYRKKLEFQNFILIEGMFKQNEERIIKIILFEIFKQSYDNCINIQEYIDCLKIFNELQVQKFGDTIMILDL